MESPADGAKLGSEQVKQFRDFLTSYNKLTEMCFGDCVHDFTIRDIRPKEDKCAMSCMEKYLKLNQRISQRFQEFQMAQNDVATTVASKS